MDLVINLSLAFLEGLGTLISPCILPVLPILFATSLVGGKRRPYGIMLGFIIAFCVFTLFARALLASSGLNLDLVRGISFALLLLLAIIMMSNYLSSLFARLTSHIAAYGTSLAAKQTKEDGFIQGILLGLPIGLIWTPCAGPIIAAVILQTIRAKTSIETFLTLLSFSLGLALPILLIILYGRKMLSRQTWLSAHAEDLRKILGATIFFAVMLTMRGSFYIAMPDTQVNSESLQSDKLVNMQNPYPLPAIQGITDWINSPPLDSAKLKGKVILIDFWTYSCINCLRTLPYLKAWDNKYRDKGLIIIGIHSPEFAFEQKLSNVQQAVKQWGIQYPVALDNAFVTWGNFKNRYWPAHYLINKQGEVVYSHFGEGQYGVTEHNIQVLLGEKGPTAAAKMQLPLGKSPLQAVITPETYLGSERMARFVEHFSAINTYAFPPFLKQDHWALQGKWEIMPQKIRSMAPGSAIKLHFKAQKVFLVLGSANNTVKTATLLLNGKPLGKLAGKAVKNSQLIIKEETLYELLSLPKPMHGMLEIVFEQAGAEAYAFTFG